MDARDFAKFITIIFLFLFIVAIIGFFALFCLIETIIKIYRVGFRNVPKNEIKYGFWLSGGIVLFVLVSALWFFIFTWNQ